MRLSTMLLFFVLLLPPPVLATTYVVTPDGTGDFPNIQSAIAAVANGDSVFLADGTFRGPGNRGIEGFGKALVVKSQSGDPEICIIDCEDMDRAFHFHGGEGHDFVLESITIVNGVADTGGAISCSPSSFPTILNCFFDSCHAGYDGGAIFFAGSNPLVQACTFTNNSAYHRGGAIGCDTSSPDITQCIFIQNSARTGGGLYCTDGSNATITECVFKNNETTYSYGGGIFCSYSSNPEIVDCYLLENTAILSGGAVSSSTSSDPTVTGCVFEANIAGDWGAGIRCNGAGTISECRFVGNIAANAGGGMSFSGGLLIPSILNCTFENNSASRGGGIAVYEQHPNIVGCTLYRNTATTEAGGIYVEGESMTTMERTIVSFSPQGEAIVVEGEGNMTSTCCDLYGNAGGDWIGSIANQYGINGNISLDPLYCDAGNSDFTLQAISPCAPFSNPNPECDLIGAWPVGCGYESIDENPHMSQEIFFSHAVPNPLTESTRFIFCGSAATTTGMILRIHDAAGRLVRTVKDNTLDAGMQTITWNGRDDGGRLVPAGSYYCRMNIGAESLCRTVSVIR